jgi:hypothetical protein
VGNDFLDVIDDGGLGQRAEIAKLVSLASNNLAHDPTHDLRKQQKISAVTMRK